MARNAPQAAGDGPSGKEGKAVVSETTDVVVTRLRCHLLKVEHAGGYQLVVGGRLLLEDRGGKKTPHADLPPYTPEMFPVDYGAWDASDEQDDRVRVFLGDNGRATHRVGDVRAATLLFAPLDADHVRAWLRSRAKGGAKCADS